MLAGEFHGRKVRVVEGGNSRQQSVENALRSLGPETDLVAVHDAVRPFIDLEIIHRAFDEAAESGAAIVGLPAVDTVKQVNRGTGKTRVRTTLPRDKLCLLYTSSLPVRFSPPSGSGVAMGFDFGRPGAGRWHHLFRDPSGKSQSHSPDWGCRRLDPGNCRRVPDVPGGGEGLARPADSAGLPAVVDDLRGCLLYTSRCV